ncbi:CaiB/BaiF CoA-transferase family protein [Pseudonocardia aurantiaca]|uniref:CaiB/BaiF CoA-transferase family protein n=1 Tax=Pseudonocardia aurantiaca TaxID=75290 RepID=A0ABW4FLI8_9PSEU
MTGPLAGVRVLELGGIGPGPFATLQLAGMGADVVRVDRVGDVGGPDAGPVPLAAGKRSVAVDLRAPGGAEAALALVERADVLVEGFRPGVAERLGLGPGACHARNPALVYGRMTGWGQHGPWAQSAGHDINYIALTGALHAIGRADGPPVVPLCLVGDLGGGGMYLVAGVLAALHEARATGRGQVVDAAIVDGVAALMGPIYEMAAAGEWVDRRGSNQLDSGRPWYDVYPARDGRYLAVGAIEDRFYARFAELLGLSPEEADRTDPGCWPALRERIAARFAAHDRAHWEAVFAGTDACVSPVLAMGEAPAHPHVAARGTLGPAGTAPAPRFDAHPPASPRPGPRAGEHTTQVLADWGGDVALDGLLDAGALAQWTPAVSPSGRPT